MTFEIARAASPYELPDWCSLTPRIDRGDLLYLATIQKRQADSIVGVLLLTSNTYQVPEVGSILEISALEVCKEFRRKQVAQKLLEAVVAAHPTSHLVVETTEHNPAAWRCYQAAGFVYLWTDLLENIPWFFRAACVDPLDVQRFRDAVDSKYNIPSERKAVLATPEG